MIQGVGFTHEKFNFPCGEMNVNVTLAPCQDQHYKIGIVWRFQNNAEIIELLLIVNALHAMTIYIDFIDIAYVPFGRMDRITKSGEAFSLKVFAELINACNAGAVIIADPHSDVTTALIKNCLVVKQEEIFEPIISKNQMGNDQFVLISPDGGALKKIYKLAHKLKTEVVECSKLRDTNTGEISGTVIHTEDLGGKNCYIVDDICDGGRTFTEIAKVLKTKNAGKIILCVTHGFFTKGLEVFDGLIDEIYTMKGKVK